MNLARNVRIVVENPYFTVTRFVATPAELTVGEMIIIVHAALGLEPSSPGQLMVREDEEPIDIFPIIDSDFYTSFGEDVHYHPSEGDWCITISIADTSRVVMGLPALISGEGPDLVTELGSPQAMFSVMLDVQASMAYMGVPPQDMERIFRLFPNYTLDQINQRLTTCYHPAIAQRLATMGTEAANLEGGTQSSLSSELPFDPFSPHPWDDFSDDVDDLGFPTELLEQWREEVYEAYPELSPDFTLPELSEDTVQMIGQRVREYLDVIRDFPRLTGAGFLKQAAVQRLKDWLPKPNAHETVKREDYHQTLLNLREFFLGLDWVTCTTSTIRVTELGDRAARDPDFATQLILGAIPYSYSPPSGAPQLGLDLVHLLRGDIPTQLNWDPILIISRDLFFALGILTHDTHLATIKPGHEGFVAAVLASLRDDLNQELD